MPYRALNGLSYPPDKRVEAGDIVNDLPPNSVKWLLARGHIEEMKGSIPLPEPVADPEEGDN